MAPRKDKMTARKSVIKSKASQAKTAVESNRSYQKNALDVRFLWECVQDMKGPGTIQGKLDLKKVAARMGIKNSAIISRFKRIARDMKAEDAAKAKAEAREEGDNNNDDKAEDATMEDDKDATEDEGKNPDSSEGEAEKTEEGA